MNYRRPSLVAAACVASLLVLIAGCDKDKKGVEPPAELVDLEADPCGPEVVGHERGRRR